MPTYQKCPKAVGELVEVLLNKFDTHRPLVATDIKIDLVFAYADEDEKGRLLNDALSKDGIKALGITRNVSLKHRALGHGDAEIALDANWWGSATAEEQAALLDHELHHIAVKSDKQGNVRYDDLGRPIIKLRKHDVEVGW